MILSLILGIVFGLSAFVIIEWKRANRRHAMPIACEGFPCTNTREYGTLWCKKHQPRKLQLKTLEERLL